MGFFSCPKKNTMSETRKIALYLRVSTNDQSTELQRLELLNYCTARGFSDVEVYEDIGKTGTNGNRPMLKQLLSDARQRKFDVIVIWKLDRLFRSLKDLINTLQEFTVLGVDFISLKDNIDLTTSSGRLMMHMLGAFAEFEASLIKERVRAGLAVARAKGKRLGRPRADYSHIIVLKQRGMENKAIAERLGISRDTVERAFRIKPPQTAPVKVQ